MEEETVDRVDQVEGVVAEDSSVEEEDVVEVAEDVEVEEIFLPCHS